MKNTRAANRSESIDDLNTQDEETSQAHTEQPAPRRSRRNGVEELKDTNSQTKQDEEEEEELDDVDAEEEITRCICGQAEYPGPSAGVKDMAKGGGKLVSCKQKVMAQY